MLLKKTFDYVRSLHSLLWKNLLLLKTGPMFSHVCWLGLKKSSLNLFSLYPRTWNSTTIKAIKTKVASKLQTFLIVPSNLDPWPQSKNFIFWNPIIARYSLSHQRNFLKKDLSSKYSMKIFIENKPNVCWRGLKNIHL